MTAKFSQFIYGFYPEAERWRVNLTFLLAAVLLIPMLIPRLPGKGINASLFFIAFPVVAFFLLHGGGLKGLGVSWTANVLSGLNGSIGEGGDKLVSLSASSAIGPLLWLLGKLLVLLSTVISWILWPLTWLRDFIQSFGRPVWADLVATAVIVSGLMFWLGGGMRAGVRALITSLVIFACIGIVIAILGLDRGGLPVVDTRLWGGLLVTLVVSVTGIVTSMPVGIALALGRRSTIPLIRVFSVAFIEFWRGVPLITVLFFATYMLPLFLPGNFIGRWSGARADRHRAVCRRLSGRGDPRRPCGNPARAGGSGKRARAVVLEDDRADRDAAGAAPRHPGPRQQLHRVVQGHLAGLDRRAVRPARAVAGRLRRSQLVDATRRCSPALPSPD